MEKYSCYLVCKEHLNEVKVFLSDFFEETQDDYTHNEWVSFKVPGSQFLVNLMEGGEQGITQNFVFEIYCDSKKKLEGYAQKYGRDIKNFTASKGSKEYIYNYIDILGPKNICKFEISYTEDLKN